MKTKTIMIAVICFLCLLNPANAQKSSPGITETEEWIQAKISMWGSGFIKESKFKGSSLLITNSSWRKKTGESGVYGYVEVEPEYIKSISIMRYDNSEWGIIICGEQKWIGYQGKYFGEDMSDFSVNYDIELPSVSLTLDKSTSETDVNKLVKALKYWATLWGAKLVNDDLF